MQPLLLGLGLGDLEAAKVTGVNQEGPLPLAVYPQEPPGCRRRSCSLPSCLPSGVRHGFEFTTDQARISPPVT